MADYQTHFITKWPCVKVCEPILFCFFPTLNQSKSHSKCKKIFKSYFKSWIILKYCPLDPLKRIVINGIKTAWWWRIDDVIGLPTQYKYKQFFYFGWLHWQSCAGLIVSLKERKILNWGTQWLFLVLLSFSAVICCMLARSGCCRIWAKGIWETSNAVLNVVDTRRHLSTQEPGSEIDVDPVWENARYACLEDTRGVLQLRGRDIYHFLQVRWGEGHTDLSRCMLMVLPSLTSTSSLSESSIHFVN